MNINSVHSLFIERASVSSASLSTDGDHLARADARLEVPADGRGRVEVVAVDEDRAADFADVGQRAQRDHLSLVVADLQQIDVVDLVAEIALGLDVDLPVAAEGVETVDVERAEIDLQRLIHVVQRYSQRGDLGPVDVQVELRRGGAELRGHADQRRLLLQLAGPDSSV